MHIKNDNIRKWLQLGCILPLLKDVFSPSKKIAVNKRKLLMERSYCNSTLESNKIASLQYSGHLHDQES